MTGYDCELLSGLMRPWRSIAAMRHRSSNDPRTPRSISHVKQMEMSWLLPRELCDGIMSTVAVARQWGFSKGFMCAHHSEGAGLRAFFVKLSKAGPGKRVAVNLPQTSCFTTKWARDSMRV